MVVAAGLRLAGLESGLWIDEITMLLTSAREPFGRIVTVFASSNQHTLYSVLAHGAIELFGESAWSIRLPACVFGIASVAMVYVLAARMLSRTEALAAAAILATSYHHVWYSQSARGYTIQGFCALASTYALLRGLDHGARRHWILYVVVCVVGIYTHLTMALVVAAHVLVVVLGKMAGWRAVAGLQIRPFLMAAVSVGLLSLALYWPFLSAVVARFEPRRASPAHVEASRLQWTLITGSSALAAIVGLPMALGSAVLGTAGLVSLCRHRPIAAALLIAPAVVVPLPFLAAGRPVFPRFFFFLSGVAVLFAARGLGALADAIIPRRVDGRPRVVLAATAIGALAVVEAVPGLIWNYRVPKQDFGGAVHFLDQAATGGARIAVASACRVYQRYYDRRDWECLSDEEAYTSLLETSSSRVLIASTLPLYLETPLRERLREDCPIVRRFPGTLSGGTIAVCEARSSQPGH